MNGQNAWSLIPDETLGVTVDNNGRASFRIARLFWRTLVPWCAYYARHIILHVRFEHAHTGMMGCSAVLGSAGLNKQTLICLECVSDVRNCELL